MRFALCNKNIRRKFGKLKQKMAPAPESSSGKDIEDVAKEAKSAVERFLGDVSKTSATQQLVLGSASGWLTGMVAAKIGKIAAVTIGGGIIALQIANHQGYISVNWDKVMRRVDKIEQDVNGEGTKWIDKVERYVDRKVDKAEDILKGKSRQARRWYHKVTGTGPEFQLEKIHIFAVSFVAGLAIGLAISK